MKIEDNQYEVLDIEAIALDLLLPKQRKRIKEKILLDTQYRQHGH